MKRVTFGHIVVVAVGVAAGIRLADYLAVKFPMGAVGAEPKAQ